MAIMISSGTWPSPEPDRSSAWSARYCAMLDVDIAAFGRRNDHHLQRCLREALYRIVGDACRIAGVPTTICHCEDRGDGILLVTPPCVPAETLLDTITSHLRAGVRQHNRVVSSKAMIQLRVAVHAGHVGFDPHGAYGTALIHLFRMLEAPQVKVAFDSANAEFAIVTSDHLYDDVIRHAPGLIDPTVYQPITITLKETQGQGWIWLTRPARPRPHGHARRRRSSAGSRSTNRRAHHSAHRADSTERRVTSRRHPPTIQDVP